MFVIEEDTENKEDDKTPPAEEEEEAPVYKLRSNSSSTQKAAPDYDCWVRPPLHFDEEAVRELSGEQIQSTLDYFSRLFSILNLHFREFDSIFVVFF